VSGPTMEHLKSVGWVLLLIYVFLLSFACISGRIFGYSLVMGVCAGIAVIVTVVFATILLFNIAIVFGIDFMKRRFGKK